MAPAHIKSEKTTPEHLSTVLFMEDWGHSGLQGISNSSKEYAHLSVAEVNPCGSMDLTWSLQCFSLVLRRIYWESKIWLSLMWTSPCVKSAMSECRIQTTCLHVSHKWRWIVPLYSSSSQSSICSSPRDLESWGELVDGSKRNSSLRGENFKKEKRERVKQEDKRKKKGIQKWLDDVMR